MNEKGKEYMTNEFPIYMIHIYWTRRRAHIKRKKKTPNVFQIFSTKKGRKHGDLKQRLAWNNGRLHRQSYRPVSITWHMQLLVRTPVSNRTLFQVTAFPSYCDSSISRSLMLDLTSLSIPKQSSILTCPLYVSHLPREGLLFGKTLNRRCMRLGKGNKFLIHAKNNCFSGPKKLQSRVRSRTVITMRFGSWRWSPEKPVMSWPVSMSTPVTVISNQNSAEYERMRVENEKWKARFMQNFNEHSSKFLDSWVNRRWTGEFQVSLNSMATSCFVKWDIFHFEVHSNGLTWTIDQSALNLQSDNHVGVQIRCGTGKSAESASMLSIESHCLHFCQEKSLISRWPTSHLFLTEMSFNVEIWQFWGETIAQEISGLNLVSSVPCCSQTVGVSGMLTFSIWKSRYEI